MAAERRYRIHGRVQGVGFRWWTQGEARRLGVSGTVRNCPDGTVEVRARAEDPVLARFRALLAQGPPGARVDRIDEEEGSGTPTGEFRIER